MRFTNLTRSNRTRALGALLLTMAIGAIAPAAQADAAYVIKPAHALSQNMCLDVEWRSQLNGARLIQWGCNGQDNQKFEVVGTDSGYVKIVNRHSKLCVDVRDQSTADYAMVWQWSCHPGPPNYHQQFLLRPTPDGFYNIVPRHVTGKCLDIQGASKAERAPLIQHGCQNYGGLNQRFSFQWVP